MKHKTENEENNKEKSHTVERTEGKSTSAWKEWQERVMRKFCRLD